jgi:hypothetical protein
LANGIKSFFSVTANKNTLSSRESIGFHNNRLIFTRFKEFPSFIEGIKLSVRCSRYVISVKQFFAENFTALKLGCLAAWAKSSDARFSEFVNKTADQWRLGPNDNKVNLVLLDRLQDSSTIRWANWQIRCFVCSARISRCDKDTGAVAC